VSQATNAGAIGIVADSVPYDFATTAFSAAIAHGIPLVFMNQPQPGNAENDKQSSLFGQGTNILSKLAAEWIINDSGGKANVLAVEDVDTNLTTTAFGYAMNEFNSACPGCKVTVVKTTSADQTNLPSLVSTALAQNPGINYVMPEIDEVVPATVSGLETGDHTGIKVVSTTGVISSIQGIASHHYVVADVGASEYAEAWGATDQLLRMLLKDPVDGAYTPPIRIFDTDNFGSLTLTTAAYDNASWFGSTAFENDFLKLWGVTS
jgi:ribose transport system substrate-binding protein